MSLTIPEPFAEKAAPPVEIKPALATGIVAKGCDGAAVAPGEVMRRVSKWLPLYTAWADETARMEVLAVEDVDPGRLQCKVYGFEGPGGIVRAHELRFVNPDAMEALIERAQRCDPNDRNHRCTCCLEWIYGDAIRCGCCAHAMHRSCASRWLARSKVCPVCRSEWKNEEPARSCAAPAAAPAAAVAPAAAAPAAAAPASAAPASATPVQSAPTAMRKLFTRPFSRSPTRRASEPSDASPSRSNEHPRSASAPRLGVRVSIAVQA